MYLLLVKVSSGSKLFDTQIVFLKEIFQKKMILKKKKKSEDNKKHEKITQHAKTKTGMHPSTSCKPW